MMLNNDWITKDTAVQVMMDAECVLTELHKYLLDPNMQETASKAKSMLLRQIELLRGPAPSCYGLDDCSTSMLSTCPWRTSCGSEESLKVYRQRQNEQI